jgi:sugar/nucleoside kinase (ribokinase family)
VSAGLLAVQGEDEAGEFIRSGLSDLNVSTEFIKVDSQSKTGECHVFIQENGERTILMAKGASSLINSQAVENHFRESAT